MAKVAPCSCILVGVGNMRGWAAFCEQLPRCEQLVELDLSFCMLGPSALVLLAAALAGMPSLRSVNLKANQVRGGILRQRGRTLATSHFTEIFPLNRDLERRMADRRGWLALEKVAEERSAENPLLLIYDMENLLSP